MQLPTHFPYHNLTQYNRPDKFLQRENLEITKICSDPGDKPCLQETAVALARGLKKLLSPYRVKIIRTFQIKSNPLVTSHKYRASDQVKKIFH